ncbi:endo-arabinase [Flavobacterium sp. LB3P122]|uniref:endo-arabinase n=1 Tax=Flavobacterium algoriphilum TaxID=3398738 RepID=UPI003A8C11DE
MKWKLSLFLILSISILGYGQKIDESESIKRLLEKESATWRAADSKGHTECWYIQPYSRILVSTAAGITIDVPPAAMINTNPSAMCNGGFAVNTNYKMSIQKNNAWVSHNEESTAKDGKKTFSYEIRLLEKIKGKWKLVGQSIHMYNLK